MEVATPDFLVPVLVPVVVPPLLEACKVGLEACKVGLGLEQVEALTGEPKPVHVGLPGRIVVHVESLVVAVAQVLAMVQCRTLGAGKGNTSRRQRTSMLDAEVTLTR